MLLNIDVEQRGQKKFVGYSSYYIKENMSSIPYYRLVSDTFKKNHKLPCDCPPCKPINSLEGMNVGFWNYRVARPHYAITHNEYMTELSRLINMQKIEKAKDIMTFSDLCALRKLIPDF